MKPTYIFDFDGTLVDSMGYWARNMLHILDTCGVEYPENIIDIITPLGNVAIARYFVEVMGIQKTQEELLEWMRELSVPAYSFEIPAKETVAETLTELRRRGCSLNVLTASPHVILDVCLKRVGIYDLFDKVWACDDFGTVKTNPEIYHAAAERLGVTVRNCIFLDDNYNACAAAKRAGMKVIGVYDATSALREDELRALCDGYVHQFAELLAGTPNQSTSAK